MECLFDSLSNQSCQNGSILFVLQSCARKMDTRLNIEDASLEQYRTVIENRHDFIQVSSVPTSNCRTTSK